jgi:hypothetical protein
VTEDEPRPSAPPTPLAVRVVALAVAARRRATEAERELPRVRPKLLASHISERVHSMARLTEETARQVEAGALRHATRAEHDACRQFAACLADALLGLAKQIEAASQPGARRVTEEEFRHGAPPSPLEARIAALALAVRQRTIEAERELPAVPPDRLEGCREAAVDLARHAAALCRTVARRVGAADPLGDPDHREPGEEP